MKGQKLLGEFEAIMQENINSMKITEKREWWSRRRALDTQLEVCFSFILCYLYAMLLAIEMDRH